jgi:uncharacterized membrane protein (UPF0136 family)
MSERMEAGAGRPRSVTGLGAALILIAVLALLNVARGLVGYFQSDVDGIATRFSLGEFLFQVPEQTLVPAVVGILAAIAAIGVFRARRWGLALAVGVGMACLVGGVLLTWPTIAEWGLPGSFALLLLPAAFVAFATGAYVLYAALGNRAFFGG